MVLLLVRFDRQRRARSHRLSVAGLAGLRVNGPRRGTGAGFTLLRSLSRGRCLRHLLTVSIGLLLIVQLRLLLVMVTTKERSESALFVLDLANNGDVFLRSVGGGERRSYDAVGKSRRGSSSGRGDLEVLD